MPLEGGNLLFKRILVFPGGKVKNRFDILSNGLTISLVEVISFLLIKKKKKEK